MRRSGKWKYCNTGWFEQKLGNGNVGDGCGDGMWMWMWKDGCGLWRWIIGGVNKVGKGCEYSSE